MTNHNTLTVTNDRQLEKYGIFNTESAPADRGSLSRQAFRDAQQQEFDVYPTDEVFLLTVLSAIERSIGESLRTGWTGQPQVAAYVYEKRPSQPDFLIDAEVAHEVLLTSRYRQNSLAADSRSSGMDRYRLSLLRFALVRAGRDVITMDEFEQPLRLSGDVFMSPTWCKKALDQDPFMLTLGDFTRHVKKMRVDEGLAHSAFRYIARELLDGARADSPDTHQFAREHLGGDTDYAVGRFSLDSVAAYRVVFEDWEVLLQAGEALPFQSSSTELWKIEWLNRDRDTIVKLAQLALSDKIPRGWFNRRGKFAPPPRDGDFEF